MSAEQTQLNVDPNASATSTIVVENTGSIDGTVQLSADGAPEGWSFQLSEDEVTVAAGETETVDLTMVAPVDHDGGPRDAAATVAGSMEDGSGQFTSSDEVTVTATMPPPPAPPPESTPWGWIAGAGAVLAGLAGIGVYVHRREPTIDSEVEITLAQEPQMRSGGEQMVAVRLANGSEDPRTAHLKLEEFPADWSGGLNREQIALEPGEERPVWVALKPSEDAETTEGVLQLRVDFAEEFVVSKEVTLELEVEEEALDPNDPSRTLVAPVGARPVEGPTDERP